VVSLGFFSGGDTGQATLTNLPLGKSTIFALDFANGPGIDVSGFSPYSNNVQITAGSPPAAPGNFVIAGPTGLRASYIWRGVVDLHWENSSNNESEFIVERSVNGGAFQQIKEEKGPVADCTDTTDDIKGLIKPGLTSIKYRVFAKNFYGESLPVEIGIPLSFAGPDVTADLIALAAQVRGKWTAPGAPGGQINGAINPFAGAMNDWDIGGMSSTSFGISGTGEGDGTVTVNGQVFDEQAVNYWLGGVIYSCIRTASPTAAAIFKAEAYSHIQLQHDVDDEKWQWFLAGAAGNVTIPQEPYWLQGIVPSVTKNTRPMTWTWGSF
jgi:hypothetical protein